MVKLACGCLVLCDLHKDAEKSIELYKDAVKLSEEAIANYKEALALSKETIEIQKETIAKLESRRN